MENLLILPLFALSARIVWLGGTPSDALALIPVCALLAFSIFIKSKKPVPLNEAIKAELEAIKVEQEHLRNSMGAIGIGLAQRKRQ